MHDRIYIFSEHLSPRLQYSFNLIFKDLLGFDKINIISELSEFLAIENNVKISYGQKIAIDIPFLAKGTELLYEQGINDKKPERVINTGLYPYFFATDEEGSLFPFDLPAMSFWLATRYEEYQSFNADQHGRFPASESYAFQNGFLQMPLLDLWAEELRRQLHIFFPNLPLPKARQFNFVPTYDIDYAWAYKHKALWRQLGAALRDLWKGRGGDFSERLSVLLGKSPDPYFTFDYIESLHAAAGSPQPIFFWLLGDYGSYDKNIDYRIPAFRKLIQRICQKYDFGIHPSYASNENSKAIEREIGRLKEITEKEVLRSRQHFLRLNFPDTYSRLSNLGIREEYSMGYAEQLGFRASIAKAFYWYDLKSEKETMLRIHPFMFMDVTLNVYQKLSPDEALLAIEPIVEITKRVGGELISIWHNNSFCEKDNWKGWRKGVEKLKVLELKEVLGNEVPRSESGTRY